MSDLAFEDVTYEQLQHAGLATMRGPKPNPMLIAIANELARNELSGIPINAQSIKQVAAKHDERISQSGGHRKRVHEYAQAIVQYQRAVADLVNSQVSVLEVNSPNISVPISLPSPLVSPPFIVQSPSTDTTGDRSEIISAALSAEADEASARGELIDVEAKLTRLAMDPKPEGEQAGPDAGDCDGDNS